MTMCSYKYRRIAITERNIFDGNDCEYRRHLIELVNKVDMVILREKNMEKSRYLELAKYLLQKSSPKGAEIILHTHIDIANKLNFKKIHLPLDRFKESLEELKDFQVVGVSAHSLEDAIYAQSQGATYITASHIFSTECKKGLPPKGLAFLKNICENVSVPVYALGGINNENEGSAIKNGASGACQMSGYMRKFL